MAMRAQGQISAGRARVTAHWHEETWLRAVDSPSGPSDTLMLLNADCWAEEFASR